MGNIRDLAYAGNQAAWRRYETNNVPGSGGHEPDKHIEIPTLFAAVEDRFVAIEDLSLAGDSILKATWSALSAITGTRNGQRGEVAVSDVGTHTDPVVGGTKANAGIYTWSVSPAGWQWLASDDTALQLVGNAIPVYSGSDSTGDFTFGYAETLTVDCWLTGITIASVAVQNALIGMYFDNGDGTYNLQRSYPVKLEIGLNVISLKLRGLTGERVGIYLPSSIKYNASGGAKIAWQFAGYPGLTNTVTTLTGTRLEFALTFESGTGGRIDALEKGSAGFELLNPTSQDSTDLFVLAQVAHPNPYVRPGNFNVNSVSASGGGLWGPGKVYIGADTLVGTRFFIPPRPQSTTLAVALRQALAAEIAANDVLTVIGDSISHNQAASVDVKHWFNLLTRFANVGIAKDEPVMTALRSSLGYLPTFYGITTTGTVTTGTRGPLGESMILAAGAVMSFTGTYEQIDVFFTQLGGAGTLAFKFNGGSAFHTVSAAGSTTLDVHSGAPATGHAGSGTYTIECSGGPVEITGLVRLGVKVSGSPPRLRTMRAAHGGYTFADFTSACVTSILAQASHWGGKCCPIIALGTNDAFATSPATIVANATVLINALVSGGVHRIFGILPGRPSSAWDASYGGGNTYDAALGPLRKLYRDNNVSIIPIASVDAVALGSTADGLHPNDIGNDRFTQIVVEHLAAQ